MDKELIKDLKNIKRNEEYLIKDIILKYYPNLKNDISLKIIEDHLKNNSFNLLTIRTHLIDNYSVYTDIGIKTANEIILKEISSDLFYQYFKANWINAILMDNIAVLFAMANLPTLTFKSLDEYINKLKTID